MLDFTGPVNFHGPINITNKNSDKVQLDRIESKIDDLQEKIDSEQELELLQQLQLRIDRLKGLAVD